MRALVDRIFRSAKYRLTVDLERNDEIQRHLLGRMACLEFRKIAHIQTLADVEFKVTSQWGEDGIIDWLVDKLAIEDSYKTFVEFGVEDYKEANTRFLLQNRHWAGVVLDGGAANINIIRTNDVTWRYNLEAVEAFITSKNINDLIAAQGLRDTIGLLSVDIDGNDYWIMKALDVVSPIILIAEYNALLGDLQPLTVPQDDFFVRRQKHYSNVYYGASIGSLIHLATERGYRLIGTNAIGSNVFFVREDYAARLDGRIADTAPRPCTVREAMTPEFRPAFNSVAERIEAIKHLPLINVATGETRPISQWGALHSPGWLAGMGLINTR